MRPTAKSLILDLLSTLRDGSMPVRALVAAGRLFALEENNVRVTLARLLRAGLVERDERGSYRPGREAEAVRRRVASWRRLDDRVVAWQGGWIAAHCGRAGGRRNERALRLLGMRPLESGLSLRPDNLVGGVAAARRQLLGLGLAPGTVVAWLGELDVATERRARELWSADELTRGYESARGELAASVDRMSGLTADEAMVETFQVGGRVLRQLVLDPLLPEPIVPEGPRLALLDDMRRYDRLGRSAWAAFLDRFGVPTLRNPIDLRLADGAGPGLAAAES